MSQAEMVIKVSKYEKMEDLAKLKSSPHQRNKHPEEQIERLAKIMRVRGVRQPIHVARVKGKVLNEIAYGHGRKAAAELNGWKKYPIVYQDFETDDEYYEAVQSDNAIQVWSELDFAAINADLGDLGPDFDIDLLGIEGFTLEPFENEGLKMGDLGGDEELYGRFADKDQKGSGTKQMIMVFGSDEHAQIEARVKKIMKNEKLATLKDLFVAMLDWYEADNA